MDTHTHTHTHTHTLTHTHTHTHTLTHTHTHTHTHSHIHTHTHIHTLSISIVRLYPGCPGLLRGKRLQYPNSSPCCVLSPATAVKYLLSLLPSIAILASCCMQGENLKMMSLNIHVELLMEVYLTRFRTILYKLTEPHNHIPQF